MPASEFECLASSGASQTELPAYRSGANQHHHHRRHHPKAKTRRSAVTGTGCEGKPMATGVAPDRGASQPAMAASSPSAGASRARSSSISSLMEFEEEQRQKHPYVSLWDPLNGERYRLQEVGEAPDFLVPVKAFKAEDILDKYLVKLTRTEKGWAELLDETTKKPVLSHAPVSAFAGDGDLCLGGSLASIANENGEVFVKFSREREIARFEETPRADLSRVSTPRSSDEDRFC